MPPSLERPPVLIVDDEKDLAELMAYNLRHSGYPVDVLHNGNRVIDLAFEKNYGLFVLDVLVPGMKGLELCQLLREEWRTQNSRILVVSAMGAMLPREKVLEAGADDYLPKPLKMVELMQRTASLLATPKVQSSYLSFPRFGLDLDKSELKIGNRRLELSPEEVSLVKILTVLPAGQWFSLDKFYSLLWTLGLNLSPKNLDRLLAGLRVKMAETRTQEPFVLLDQEKGIKWSPH